MLENKSAKRVQRYLGDNDLVPAGSELALCFVITKLSGFLNQNTERADVF